MPEVLNLRIRGFLALGEVTMKSFCFRTSVVLVCLAAAATVRAQQPDIEFSSDPTAAPRTLVAGQEVTITIPVTNTGSAPTGAFQIALQRLVMFPPFPTLHEHFLPNGLGPGQSQTITFNVVLDLVTTYNLRVALDSSGAVAESDESNNTFLLGNVTVEAPAPNLVFDGSVTKADDIVCEGGHTVLSGRVRNDGNVACGSFDVSAYRWIGTGWYLLQTNRLSGLGSGGSETFFLGVTFATADANMRVILDTGSEIEESDENDNAYNVGWVQVSRAPDLFAEIAPTLSSSAIEPGASLTVSGWTLRNSCIQDATAFQIGYYLSVDEQYQSSDRILYVSPPMNLPGESALQMAPVEVSIPQDAELGPQQIIVVVDPVDNVDEIHEDNNVVLLGITVPVEVMSWGDVKARYR